MNIQVVSLFVVLMAIVNKPVRANESEFNEHLFDELVRKMEADVVELARYTETIYADRCDPKLLSECTMANYEHCLSSLPDPSCPAGEEFHNKECGHPSICSGKVSFATSSIVLHDDLTQGMNKMPTDPQVIESVCFSKGLNQFFVSKRNEDDSYWKQFGYEPSGMYFGSQTGAFRYYPGTRFRTCGDYDPRVRPWYVAASSGPKNVIMILDTSGSMKDNNKIELLKVAAKRIVSTLSTSDRIAILPFSNMAYDITGNNNYLTTATYENIDYLVNRISGLSAEGGTNFYDPFEKAFDMLESSFLNDYAINCNTAIIFFTDGEMNQPEGVETQDVIDMIGTRLTKAQELLSNPIYFFTYSIAGGVRGVNEFPSELACSVPNGIWSLIEDEREIVDNLSSYYKLFALGLGDDGNEEFVAWVEPYEYASWDVMGTTVSAPVYDRSKEPHLFLGVVGMDFVMPALNAALGDTDGKSEESIRRVVARSTARCPLLNLDECVLESYRRQSGAGDLALCPNINSNCSELDFIQIQEEKCRTVSDYTNNLWANTDNRGLSVSEASCCSVNFINNSSCTISASPKMSMWSNSIENICGYFAAAVVVTMMM